MESSDDRKRKRPEQESDIVPEEKSSSGVTRPAPSEEEVEEFFTLIRRIHSVKYSGGKSSHGNVNRAASGRRIELVAGLSAQLSGGSADHGRKGVKGVSIDLNAVPEEAGDGNSSS